MVRAGVVNHPERWKESGFKEIQKPSKRYAIIDLQSLRELSGFADLRDFQRAHRQWVEQGLENGLAVCDDHWSESIAVGTLDFIEKIKTELGMKAMHRDFEPAGKAYALREPSEAYAGGFASENEALSSENTVPWPLGKASSKRSRGSRRSALIQLLRYSVVRPGERDTNHEIIDYTAPTHKFQPAADSLRSLRQRRSNLHSPAAAA